MISNEDPGMLLLGSTKELFSGPYHVYVMFTTSGREGHLTYICELTGLYYSHPWYTMERRLQGHHLQGKQIV